MGLLPQPHPHPQEAPGSIYTYFLWRPLVPSKTLGAPLPPDVSATPLSLCRFSSVLSEILIRRLHCFRSSASRLPWMFLIRFVVETASACLPFRPQGCPNWLCSLDASTALLQASVSPFDTPGPCHASPGRRVAPPHPQPTKHSPTQHTAHRPGSRSLVLHLGFCICSLRRRLHGGRGRGRGWAGGRAGRGHAFDLLPRPLW